MDGFEDGVGLWKLPRFQLAVNFLSIDADLKGPAARRDQPERANFLFELEKFFRQTDGLRLIVSSGAVFDGDFYVH